MTIHLLDVNVLIALLDRHHIHHASAYRWFRADDALPWASCPIVENGVVRILSSSAYPNATLTAGQVVNLFSQLKTFGQHHFWPDSVSLDDAERFQPDYIAHSKDVTDVYLLGLARSRKGKLATFDRRISQAAVSDATEHLLYLG